MSKKIPATIFLDISLDVITENVAVLFSEWRNKD